MPSHFTLRMQFGPHEDPENIKKQLLDLFSKAPADEIMVFMFAEEQNSGHEPMERIKLWLERSRPYRKALAEKGIIISANPWHTLLHMDNSRKFLPEQKWQAMVGPDGAQCKATVCPLDPNWRKYYEDNLRLFGKEGFRVIWIDDDIRFHNHAPLDWGGCFCPLHVAEFNRRAGVKATRDEIVKNCTAPGKPHPWREKWMDMWDETQTEMIARWRDILAETGTRLGLMSSYMAAHGAEGRKWERWWKAFGGDKPPIHRPAFCSYGETLGRDIVHFISNLDQNRTIQPPVIESGPEIDNGYYGPWNKPYIETAAQMSLSHILGSTNLNISLYDFLGNRPSDEPERVDFLKSWRPVCDWLADQFPMSLKSVGVGVPWSEDMGRRMHTDGSGKWQSLMCQPSAWSHWLGAAGIAFQTRPDEHVNALGGQLAWAFDDDTIKACLKGSLLLDGEAAAILVERGYGEEIGFSKARIITRDDVLYSIEHCTDSAFALHENAEMSVNIGYAARVMQGTMYEGAKIISELRNPHQEYVGHGAMVYENANAGRIAVVPWFVNLGMYMTTHRAAQLRRILEWLDPENHYGEVTGGAWLVPQFLNDGDKWRGVVWNGSADPVKTNELDLPHGMPKPKKCVQVTGDARRIDVCYNDGRIDLDQPLRTWEYIVLL